MKIRPLLAEIDKQTEMTKLIVAFRNYANASNDVKPEQFNSAVKWSLWSGF